MLSSCVKSLNNNVLNKYFNYFKSSIFCSNKVNFSKAQILYNENENRTKSSDYVLTENLPPIPPNYGFPGDENIKSIYEMKRIKSSFQYGNPPKIRRRFIKGPQVIRLMPITHCSNRRFFRIAVTRQNCDLSDGFIEDLGSIDPMPNKDNQILIALNIERIKFYLSKSVPLKGKVGEILGLAGLLPVHPRSYLTAFKNRKKLENKTEDTAEKKAEKQ